MADVLKVARTVSELGGGEVVLIGGVATYLQVQRRPRAGLPLEMTHDVDVSVSMVAMGTIRELEATTKNERLHKWQLDLGGVEVDIYPQHASKLRFGYDDLRPYAQTYRGLSIASVPHLALLKLDALRDRGRSGKGDKDRRDLAKLVVLLHGTAQTRRFLATLASRRDVQDIDRDVLKSSAFMMIARGNAKVASELRTKAIEAIADVEKRL
jgi:hypothetical protein